MTGRQIISVLAAWSLAALGLAAMGVIAPQLLAQQSPPAPEPPAEESFLTGAPDLPLMPGLTEDQAASFLFDKPAGRILAARVLAGSPGACVEAAEVRRFYSTTLPQLGWLPAGDGLHDALSTPPAETALIYLREGERLTIEFGPEGATGAANDGDCLELRFLLSPASAIK